MANHVDGMFSDGEIVIDLDRVSALTKELAPADVSLDGSEMPLREVVRVHGIGLNLTVSVETAIDLREAWVIYLKEKRHADKKRTG